MLVKDDSGKKSTTGPPQPTDAAAVMNDAGRASRPGAGEGKRGQRPWTTGTKSSQSEWGGQGAVLLRPTVSSQQGKEQRGERREWEVKKYSNWGMIKRWAKRSLCWLGDCWLK